MKYVGEAMSEIEESTVDRHRKIPLIGIATWGVILGRRDMARGQRQDVLPTICVLTILRFSSPPLFIASGRHGRFVRFPAPARRARRGTG